MMQAYINSIGIISPQLTFDGSFLSAPIVHVESQFLMCEEPVYKEFINPVQLRRMSRILKMGLGASSICMDARSDVRPDAIVVGTGLACVSDLEKFLLSIDDNQEKMLSPIPFINSSHNTVGAQIAMMRKLTGYNMTYCHRSFSFESALLDALMLIAEGGVSNTLVGGIDEHTEGYFKIFNLLDFWRKKSVDNLSLFEGSHLGTICGEGAAFFFLEKNRQDGTLAKITDVQTFLKECDASDVKGEMDAFLGRNGLTEVDVDMFVLGRNGDSFGDGIYLDLERLLPESCGIAYYKHLCGEYMTSTSFALWLAAQMLHTQKMPDVIIKNPVSGRQLRRILIYNHHRRKEHSLILVENADL